MKPKVYFARLEDNASDADQGAAAGRALAATGFAETIAKRDLVAIKLHVGELNNVTHVRPEVAAAVVEAVKAVGGAPFLTDTSTLYKGQRENAVMHALHAHAHGFGIDQVGAPFIALDGLSGTHEREVEVDGELDHVVKVAGELALADGLAVISHATGHPASGIGAAIKNVGMGLASRAGKMRQHSTVTPEVMTDKCQNCGKCIFWCPAEAIVTEGGASSIIGDLCIGCGECIAVCRFGAIKFNYEIESAILQKSMTEHAAGAIARFGEKAVFINVLTDMTRGCDCFDIKQKKIVADVGIIASDDLVAIDQASLDLTAKAHGENLSHVAYPQLDPSIQIEHAAKIGLGSRDYELVEV